MTSSSIDAFTRGKSRTSASNAATSVHNRTISSNTVASTTRRRVMLRCRRPKAATPPPSPTCRQPRASCPPPLLPWPWPSRRPPPKSRQLPPSHPSPPPLGFSPHCPHCESRPCVPRSTSLVRGWRRRPRVTKPVWARTASCFICEHWLYRTSPMYSPALFCERWC